ncbi:MAG: class I SAM-dependent methyltransferase [Longimicrobiales bacterium]
MKDAIYRTLGRAGETLEWFRHRARGARFSADSPAPPGFDRTGLVSLQGVPAALRDAGGGLVFARYESVAHSLWRAQELTLFHAHWELLPAPLMDFGAGDGSFTAVLASKVAWAVDSDPDALAAAGGLGIYESVAKCTGSRIPLPDRSVRSVMSNSVLEHVDELDAVLAEIARVLVPGGRLGLTVPLSRYTEHLTTWFGPRAAAAVNIESSHRNMMTRAEWLERLERVGFSPSVVREYQPDWFTYWYRMLRLLGPRGLGRVPGVQAACWRLWGGRWADMVRSSISETEDGACLFVIAERSGT